MIVQTVRIDGTKITARGPDFKDLRFSHNEDKSVELNLTQHAFDMLKEAFAKGEASVSTAGKRVEAPARAPEAPVSTEESKAQASEKADTKKPSAETKGRKNGNKTRVKK